MLQPVSPPRRPQFHGTIFKLPIVEPFNLFTTVQAAKTTGLKVVAAHPHADQKWLHQAELSGDCLIVLGSEGLGISPEILAACDQAVAIPMHNQVDSLNVGTAGAIFLFEARRQRASEGR